VIADLEHAPAEERQFTGRARTLVLSTGSPGSEPGQVPEVRMTDRDAPMVVADSIPGPARLQVRHLRLMLAIGSSGSITRAARSLNLSQSALSHQLIDLERDLGVSLFDRIGRRMVATAAGDRLLAAARSILPDMSDVETKIMASRRVRPPLKNCGVGRRSGTPPRRRARRAPTVKFCFIPHRHYRA